MRTDHYAFQRATRVAGFGFFVQLLIGLTMLVFGLVANDTTFIFGSLWVLLGLLVWLGLIIIFNQQKLERLEALEEEELSARTAAESVFEAAEHELRVASRRLRLMHRWVMPTLSLVVAVGLGVVAWLIWRQIGEIKASEANFLRTPHSGWAVAICLGFSAVAFIVSRFVAGMAKQPAWQNLRGGAAWMVGNSLVTLAIAVGIGFQFFKNVDVTWLIARAIPIFMAVIAAEIVLNFVLNLYRPRIPGETPRPASDSKLLSLFSAPDNLVRSINEQVNYQFGFDVTSSWGYQLLIRSVTWLLVVGVGMMVLLNTVVIVEPNQEAVKLSRGKRVGEPQGSGVMLKQPWPLQTAQTYDVSTVRTLHLTSKQVRPADVQLWTDPLGQKFDAPLTPFIVGHVRDDSDLGTATDAASLIAEDNLGRTVSLVDAEIVLQYRIREQGGLLDFLDYSSAPVSRRSELTIQEAAVRDLALREITQALSTRSLDDVLRGERAALPIELRDTVQAGMDAMNTGVEIIAVDFLMIRPAGDTAVAFEELSISNQARVRTIASADQRVAAGLTQVVGNLDLVGDVLRELDEYQNLRDTVGVDDPATLAQQDKVEQLLVAGGGEAATEIARAKGNRWVRLMDAQAEANRLRGQAASYEAAPRLYREREKMMVYGNRIGPLRKYVLCIDPDRIEFDIDVRELNSMFSISDAVESDPGGSQ